MENFQKTVAHVAGWVAILFGWYWILSAAASGLFCVVFFVGGAAFMNSFLAAAIPRNDPDAYLLSVVVNGGTTFVLVVMLFACAVSGVFGWISLLIGRRIHKKAA